MVAVEASGQGRAADQGEEGEAAPDCHRDHYHLDVVGYVFNLHERTRQYQCLIIFLFDSTIRYNCETSRLVFRKKPENEWQ